MVYPNKIRFEWDDFKAQLNEAKHGVSFEKAITSFDDPFALIAPDEKHSSKGEVREWLIGESDDDVLVIVFTRRLSGCVFRIISARKAGKWERKSYEEAKRVSF